MDPAPVAVEPLLIQKKLPKTIRKTWTTTCRWRFRVRPNRKTREPAWVQVLNRIPARAPRASPELAVEARAEQRTEPELAAQEQPP
jgi:hypothetical protein